VRGDAPDDVGEIVGDDQRAARVDAHADRAAAGEAVFAEEAEYEIDRFAGRTAIAERDENDLVADRWIAVPAAVFADENTIGERVSHRRHREGEAECGDVRAERIVGR